MTTITSATPPQQPQSTLTLDSLSYIDLATLTQSELLALSRCSSSAFDLHHAAADVVVPSIDRSTFNESAGSRRQTFCRPGPSSPSSSIHHRSRVAVAGRLYSSSSKSLPVSDAALDTTEDPHHLENRSVIASLKQSLRNLPEFYDIDLDYAPPISFVDYSLSLGGGEEKKSKRGRKPKPKLENLNLKLTGNSVTAAEDENGIEIVNKNGVRVNLVALAGLENPYGPELRRRTEGMGSEEDLLGFLRDLGGQWCSRRKKRKIVDAGVLGDVFPVGWKLLLGLKRKEGCAWVYCRRYISPGGRQFITCKEVSMYLQSYFGLHDVLCSANQDRNDVQQEADRSVSQNQLVGATLKEDPERQSDEHPKRTLIHLAEVYVHDLFECHKCNMTFDKKDEYLQHLLSLHQRTTKRCRLGSSVGDGVIVKDGKFECQFCHKAFSERRRYNGHVGIHVRNYVRGVEEKPGQLTLQQRTETTTKDESDARISRMDALVEIAKNSMLETSPAPSGEPTEEFISDELNMVSNDELPASGSENELNSEFSFGGIEDNMALRDLNRKLQEENSKDMITDEKIENVADVMDVVDVKVVSCLDTTIAICTNETNDSESETFSGKYELAFTSNVTGEPAPGQERGAESHLTSPVNNQEVAGLFNEFKSLNASPLEPLMPGGVDKSEHTGTEKTDSGPSKDVLATFVRKTRESVLCKEAICPLQPSQDSQACNRISGRGEDGLYSIGQSDTTLARCEELRLEEVEQLNLNFVREQQCHTVQLIPMDVSSNEGIEETTYDSSVQLKTQEVMSDMGGGNHLTTVCVWCGIEFSHQEMDSEIQSGSVGYMCLICKAKTSGQIGMPDDSSTINSTL